MLFVHQDSLGYFAELLTKGLNAMQGLYLYRTTRNKRTWKYIQKRSMIKLANNFKSLKTTSEEDHNVNVFVTTSYSHLQTQR
jgi:hypothetical protein